jgi:hypothetical protein
MSLEPCLSCGEDHGAPVLYRMIDYPIYRIVCDTCEAKTRKFWTIEEAVAVWNDWNLDKRRNEKQKD